MKKLFVTTLAVAIAMTASVSFARNERGDWDYSGKHNVDDFRINNTKVTTTAAELNSLAKSGREDGMPMPWQVETGVSYTDTFVKWAVDDTTTNPLAWLYSSDSTGAALLQAGTTGGVAKISQGIADNDEVYIQLGAVSDEAFCMTTNSGKKFWYKARVQATVTNEDCSYALGMAEGGAATGNFLTDNNGELADVDFYGFNCRAGTNKNWNAVYRYAGSNAMYKLAVVANNEDWHEFEMYFDGLNLVKWYVDDSLVWTITNDTAPIAFPQGQETMPIFAAKAGATNPVSDLPGLNIDWVKINQQL